MTQRNLDIRWMCRSCGLPLWRLAEELKISAPTLFRHLNKNLTDKERDRILNAVRTASQKQAE